MTLSPDLDLLVWLDLETTGLHENTDEIVGIAAVATTADLEVIDVSPELLINTSIPVVKWPEKVQEMHKANGLIDCLAQGLGYPLPEAERSILKFVQSLPTHEGVVPMCGNNISFDRRFLTRYMPDLTQWFHYRNIDVSTVKELVRRWNSEGFAKAPEKKMGHMPLMDIMESIEELKFYRSLGIS